MTAASCQVQECMCLTLALRLSSVCVSLHLSIIFLLESVGVKGSYRDVPNGFSAAFMFYSNTGRGVRVRSTEQ